jgi:hypothetical protein
MTVLTAANCLQPFAFPLTPAWPAAGCSAFAGSAALNSSNLLQWQGTLTDCVLPVCAQVRQLEWDTMGAAGAGKLGKQGAAGDGELQPFFNAHAFLPCTSQHSS